MTTISTRFRWDVADDRMRGGLTGSDEGDEHLRARELVREGVVELIAGDEYVSD
jgi:hypothetical protein